jgi:hypothetical protein
LLIQPATLLAPALRCTRTSLLSFGAQVPIVKQIFMNIQRDAADEEDAGSSGAPCRAFMRPSARRCRFNRSGRPFMPNIACFAVGGCG